MHLAWLQPEAIARPDCANTWRRKTALFYLGVSNLPVCSPNLCQIFGSLPDDRVAGHCLAACPRDRDCSSHAAPKLYALLALAVAGNHLQANMATTTVPRLECIICTNPVIGDSKLQLPCGHIHCAACVRANFRVTMRSAPFRPVQCCQRIDINVLRWVAGMSRTTGSSMDITAYRQLLTEFDTTEKLYCWDRKCGAFIPLALRAGNDSFGHSALCRKCHTKTCIRCKEKFHFGPCPASRVLGVRRRGPTADELFRRLSRKRGWKACPSCKYVVEKTDGCNHISCVCGTHWCYRCGKAPYDSHGPCAM
ncbi:hypothetical protein B0T14DRAFT_34942 [Immersiella caudata]|uniref:RBR-type E3 ubiquitin transferase n=1 Tax=Immersiella caudata TaxID=314043 RepID=A0AA39XEJ2_9PEZI|nr:hypothetical protein B0T14DRAFT_34942 [Immersiella caudata]